MSGNDFNLGGKIDSVKMGKIRRALISVFDKSGIEGFARKLVELGVEIVSTGGTAKFLREKGIEVREVEEVTRSPEMLGGRVKTLHPAIHAAILARRENPSDMKTLAERGITPIDLVVVNLYPFAETVKAGASLEEALEQIDIGGPTLIRAAAKNYPDVGVVVNPKDYDRVISELGERGDLDERLRLELATEAFAHTASYDLAVHNRFAEGKGETFPDLLRLTFEKVGDVRYGENPHQRAALYREERPWGIASARQLQGKEISFNNLVDLDAALELVLEFEEPAAVIVKHANPCGAAKGKDLLGAYERAHACDPLSAYGGIIAVNRPLDEATAGAITSTFIEAIVAPAYLPACLGVLRRKGDLRVLELPPQMEKAPPQFKQISGGMLVQEKDVTLLLRDDFKVVTEKKPSREQLEDLKFAWKVAKHAKSNAIVLAKDGQTVGIGAGQMSRIDSTELAIEEAGERARGAVMASDGFLPFADSIEVAAEAGIAAIVQPGGSIRDAEVIEAANRRGLAMVFTGIRHFRH